MHETLRWTKNFAYNNLYLVIQHKYKAPKNIKLYWWQNRPLVQRCKHSVNNAHSASTIESQVEPEVQPEIESQVEPEVEPKVEPEVESEVEPKLEHEVAPKIEPQVESDVEPEAEPEVESEVEPEAIKQDALK